MVEMEKECKEKEVVEWVVNGEEIFEDDEVIGIKYFIYFIKGDVYGFVEVVMVFIFE